MNSANSQHWFFATSNQRQGPISFDELRRLVIQGKLGKDDLVWSKGMKEWQPASTIDGLFPKPAPVPAPPAAQTKARTIPAPPPESPKTVTKPHAPATSKGKAASKLPLLAVAGIAACGIIAAAAYWLGTRNATPIPQTISPAPAQATNVPASQPVSTHPSSPPAPQEALNPPSDGASAANVSALKIEKRDITDKNDKLDIDVAYPHTGIAAIDNEIEAWARGEVERTRQERAAPDAPNGHGWELAISYDVERNDEKIIAFVVHESSYTGGAHGNQRDVTFNYLLPDGRRVDLSNILDANALPTLSALVIADLNRQSHENDDSLPDEMIEQGAGAVWNNFSAFTWQPDKLHIFFSPYQVGPYSSGPQEVHIPIAKLQGLIRPDWRAPTQPIQQSSRQQPTRAAPIPKPTLPVAAPTPEPANSQIVQSSGIPPSFDCGRASTVTENAICASPDLQNLDGQLGRIFSDVIAIAPAPRFREVRAGQKAWIKDRDATCNEDLACLGRYYRERLATLNQIKTNGFPAPVAEVQAATPTPQRSAVPTVEQAPLPAPQPEAPTAPTVAVDSITFGHGLSANGEIKKPDNEFGDKDMISASIKANVQSSNPQTLDVVWSSANDEVLQRDRTSLSSGSHFAMFNYSNPKGLPVGQYKLGVYVDGKLISNNSFSITPSRLDKIKNGLEKFGIKVQVQQH